MKINMFQATRTSRVATLPTARMLHCSLLALALLIFSADRSAAQTRYPLTCRGGGGISLSLVHNEGATVGTSSVNNNLVVGFRKSPWGSFLGLQPGECAWADRAIASSEPGVLCISGVSVQIALRSREDGYFQAFTYTNNASSANANAKKAFEGLLYSWQFQTFFVYNDRQGCLRP